MGEFLFGALTCPFAPPSGSGVAIVAPDALRCLCGGTALKEEGTVTAAKVDFSSVSWGSVEWTNLVTLYLRAHESRSKHPILGDHAAAQAVDRIEYDFKRIHRNSLPASNQYLVALRAKQLDTWCADFLARHPDAVVLHLGCGLDGRAFRLDVPPSVQWFDLDQPSVIELRRRLYDETERYRMIGSSVTDPQWLDHIPTGRPTLVVAEGLLMYVEESQVRQLFARLMDRFDCGELQFDTLSALAPRMSKLFTRGIIKWGIGNARDIETWHPKLRFVEQTSALTGYEKIDSTAVRWIYRFVNASPFGPYDMLNRFRYEQR
jgi:methyltransferase (TIGR00027 family)